MPTRVSKRTMKCREIGNAIYEIQQVLYNPERDVVSALESWPMFKETVIAAKTDDEIRNLMLESAWRVGLNQEDSQALENEIREKMEDPDRWIEESWDILSEFTDEDEED